MKKLMIILALTLVVTAGCTKQETKTENSLIDSNSPQVENTEEVETSTEENTEENSDETTDTAEESAVTPADETVVIDPQTELESALSRKNSIDIKASDADIEKIILEPESESWDPRVLEQYTDDDQILKLTVTEPTDSGKMTGLTTFYYDEGELFFIESSFANYVFAGGDLRIWTDENYNVLGMSDTDLDRREEVLVDYLVNYLEMFDGGVK